MKRVFIVHGWDGSPQEGWFPWLKAELEKNGFTVQVPVMPNPNEPRPETWVPYLANVVGVADAQTYFVGHSMGCQAILRYFATLTPGVKVGGAVFVAGFSKLVNIESSEEGIRSAWLDAPLDTRKVKNICERMVAIFSPTDKWVPLENKEWFGKELGAQTLIVDGKGEKGHFTGSDGVVELPEALAVILALAAPAVITIDDFAKIQIKMGKILSAERIEGSDKLLKLSINVGESTPRTICSGIAQYYSPEDMTGKMVPVITNLAPRKMRGVESNGMVLFAIDETPILSADGIESKPGHVPVILNPMKEVPPGSPVA